MRELIDLLESVVTESRGLGARRMGEEFVSTTNPDDKIYINSVTFYPQREPNYATPEQVSAAIKQVRSKYPKATIALVADFKKTDLSFGVAVFDRPAGPQLVFIKPFREVKPDPVQNHWDNQTGIPGFRYNSKASIKSLSGLMPQDILVAKSSDLKPGDIIDQIAKKFGRNSPFTKAAIDVTNGVMPVVIPAQEGISFSAYRDYFCELLHPIALQVGNYSGDAGGAAMKFLGTEDFSSTTINFGTDKTEGLCDSVLMSSTGRKLKVSSKGGSGGGAAAGIKNLQDAVNETSLSNSKLMKKHTDILAIISTVASNTAEMGPLILGTEFDIISEQDLEQLRKFKSFRLIKLSDLKKIKMSSNLKKIILSRKPDDPKQVNLYFHGIAAVAHLVARHINDKTKFSDAASEILNNGALVQIYTKASESSNKWTIDSFTPKWPGNGIVGVKFSALKTYYSTGIKGKFTFKIITTGYTDVEDAGDQYAELQPEAEVEEPLVKPGARVKEIRPRAATAARQQRGIEAPKRGVGREKR
jgi:hypothetical protein